MKTSEKYSDINIFLNSSIIYRRKLDNIANYWINIFLIGSILFVFIAFFYEYTISDYYYAKVINNENENYVYLTVDETFISYRNRNYLNINDIDCTCHLNDFSDNYYISNGKKYWEAKYNCDIPKKLNVNNSIVKVQINKRKTTLFKEFKNKLKEEVKNARTKK